MNEEIETKYSALLGRKGIDEFCLYFEDGTTIPWPTIDELKKFDIDFPPL